MELMTQEDFNSKLSEIIFRFTWMTKYPKRETEKEYDDCMDAVKAAYAAALARIATLEEQLAAQREQIERLLSEAAHS